MMLTALGIDASKLDAYGDGEPFKDASGKVVHNLVEELTSITAATPSMGRFSL